MEAQVALQTHPFVVHALVVGRGRPFNVAFLTLDRNTLEPMAEARGVTVAQLAASPQVVAVVLLCVCLLNHNLSRFCLGCDLFCRVFSPAAAAAALGGHSQT
jgi:hypothetical protein